MALTPAEKQRRYRDRLNAATQMSPDVVEGALVQEADRCEELSSEQRAALADKLGAIAKRHLKGIWSVIYQTASVSHLGVP